MIEPYLRRFPLVAIAAVALATGLLIDTATAQQPVDEALAAAYERLKADPNLQDEQARHRMLMEMADQYSQYAEAAFQATEDLQSYAAKVRATGLMFRTPLAKVKQFDRGLKRFTEHSAFKNFQKYAAIRGHVSTVVGLGDRLAATLNNPNLPPGARNSLLALQSLGAGLEQLGNIPLAGPMLEGYGQILSGLTDVMNNLAGKATATTKEGVFSAAEEQTVLKGLDRTHQYVKTPLWHRGIPLVHEYPFAAGKERYYLQMPSGTWIGVAEYDAVASIAADHYLTTKKNPDAQTLWRIFNDPEEQDSLRFRAELELEIRKADEVLGDLPGVDRRTRYRQYLETRERIQNWHKALGLPLEYGAMNRLIRIEVANPGSVARALRARVLRAYPGFAEYLASRDEDPQSLDFDALLARFGEYRAGESLGGGLVGPDCFLRIPDDLPEGWWHAQCEAYNRGNNHGTPFQPYDNDFQWRQQFVISRDRGFVPRDNRTVSWYDPQNSKRRWSSTRVVVHIDGPYHGTNAKEMAQGKLDRWIKEDSARYVTDAKKSVILNYTQGNGSQHLVKLILNHRGCHVFLQLSSKPGTNSDCTEAMALDFGRCLCRNIDRHFGGKSREKVDF